MLEALDKTQEEPAVSRVVGHGVEAQEEPPNYLSTHVAMAMTGVVLGFAASLTWFPVGASGAVAAGLGASWFRRWRGLGVGVLLGAIIFWVVIAVLSLLIDWGYGPID